MCQRASVAVQTNLTRFAPPPPLGPVTASGDVRDPRVSDAESWVMVEAEAGSAHNSVTGTTQNGGVEDEAEQQRLAAVAEAAARAAEEEEEARQLAEAEAVAAKLEEEERLARAEQEEKDRCPSPPAAPQRAPAPAHRTRAHCVARARLPSAAGIHSGDRCARTLKQKCPISTG